MGTIASDLKATALAIDLGEVSTESATEAHVTATMTWTLPIAGQWSYQVPWTWTRSDSADGDDWRLDYSPAIIHPRLGPQRTLVVRESPTTAGTIVDRDDAQLIAPVRVYSVVVLVDKVSDVTELADRLATILAPFDDSVTADAIASGIADARRTGAESYTVINLREQDFDRIDQKLTAIPALSLPSSMRDLPPTKDFASVLLSQATPVATDMIHGTPGWRIMTVDAAGDELETLDEKPPVPGAKVTLTIDRQAQNAAQRAVDAIEEPTVLVAIQPSTGEILAVAQNAPANAQGPIALTGQYPPGSIFKIVTATAAIGAGLITGTTEVGCPGSFPVGKNVIHNEGFALGTVTATTAFAHSCNTTFAKLGTEMGEDALPKTAAQFGIGLDFDITGIITLTGKIQTANSYSAKAQNGFGQGTDLVTPFSAALMAATVAAGHMPTPTLIRGTTTTVDRQAPALPEKADRTVKRMMRAVVTDGTAKAMQDAGEVYAKTGTAEYVTEDGDIAAHAWTVGFRGDVAFSALIVGGNSSQRTNVLLDTFLKALPAD